MLTNYPKCFTRLAVIALLFVCTNIAASPAPPKFSGRVVEMQKRVVKSGVDTLVIAVNVPRGYHLTNEAPSLLSWYSSDPKAVSFARTFDSYKPGTIHFPFHARVNAKPGMSTLTFDATVYFCANKSTVCMYDKLRITVPIEVAAKGATSVTLSADLEAPEK